MNRMLRWQDWQYPLLLSVVVLFFFSPLLFSETHFKSGVVTSDFPASIEFAQHLQQGAGDVPGYILAHSAWVLLLIAGNGLFGVSFRMGAFLVSISSILATALVLYFFWFAPVLKAKGISRWWGVLGAFGLNLITPLSLLATIDRRWYLGYIGITSYHNPTIILLQPFALLQFILALRCFQLPVPSWKDTVVAATISLLAAFAKPSFAICFLPAFCLMAAWRWKTKEVLHWRLFLLGFFIPTIILLAAQYLIAYGSPDQSKILFRPLAVLGGLSGFLGIKLVLSVVFPLLITILYFREVARDHRMVLSWVTFLVAASYAYLLAEGAPRTLDGNFIWGAKTALLVLFSVSTLFLFEKFKEIHSKILLTGGTWVWHVVYGVLYYHHIITTQKYI